MLTLIAASSEYELHIALTVKSWTHGMWVFSRYHRTFQWIAFPLHIRLPTAHQLLFIAWCLFGHLLHIHCLSGRYCSFTAYWLFIHCLLVAYSNTFFLKMVSIIKHMTCDVEQTNAYIANHGTYLTNYRVTVSSNIAENPRRLFGYRRGPFEYRRRPLKTACISFKTVEHRFNIVEDHLNIVQIRVSFKFKFRLRFGFRFKIKFRFEFKFKFKFGVGLGSIELFRNV